MHKKSTGTKLLLRVFHKLARYTKQQKLFVIYLLVLFFFMVLFPVIKISPVNSDVVDRIFFLSGPYFPLMIILYLCMGVLLLWNMSFRFKNMVIHSFGFKEDDALFNFGFLFVVLASFLAIGSTVGVSHRSTSTVSLTFWFYLMELLLVLGMVMTLLIVIKKAKKGEKTKIVNIVDADAEKKARGKQDLEGLFGKKYDMEDEEEDASPVLS